jgi:acyl carrier protein
LNLEAEVIACVAQSLALNPRQAGLLGRATALLGAHPDFDSMAVLALITALEDRLGVAVAEDISADAFASVGTLVDAMASRLPS